MKRGIKISLFASAGLAFILAVLVVGGALQHNPQCEFYCEGNIHYLYIIQLFVIWFAMGFAVLLIPALVFSSLYDREG